MINSEQRRQVERLFREAGYAEPVTVAPVTSEEERVFVLTPGSGLVGRRDLEASLQAVLRRKAWIVEVSDPWPSREPLH